MNKTLLKEGYYYEEKPWYDTLPETIAEPNPFKTIIFEKDMTHDQILKEYNIVPYNSYMDAAIVCLTIIHTLKNDCKSRIIYFKESNILYRFSAWRDGVGKLSVRVSKVRRGSKYYAGSGACFSNVPLKSLTEYLSPSDTLTLESAIKIVKQAGYKIIHTITTEVEI